MINESFIAAGGSASLIKSGKANAYSRLHSQTEQINGPPTHAITSLSSRSGGSTYSEGVFFSNCSSSAEVTQSVAERAREKKLRDDPMAEVLGPLFVDCKRCGARIKLSSKSTYDIFHWRTHRERCLKRTSVPRKKQQTKEVTKPSTHSPSTASPQPGVDPLTPPLTPDNGDETGVHDGDQIKGESSPSPSSPPGATSAAREPDLVFEEYLLRSHRKLTRKGSLGPPEHWQNWSWSQLKAPDFVVDYPNSQEGGNLMMDEETQLRDDAVSSLSILSRST